MNRRRLVASLLVGAAVGWGMSLAPLARPRATLPAQKYGGLACFFSPDAQHLITANLTSLPSELPANMGAAHLWDVATGAHIAVLGRSWQINSVTFSPDGATVAGRQVDGTILIWERTTGRLLEEIGNDGLKRAHPHTQIVYAPAVGLLFQDVNDWTVMRRVDTGNIAFDVRPLVRDCNSATVNHQDFYLAAGGHHAVAVSLATGEVVARFESRDHELDVNGTLSPDGRALALWLRNEPGRIAVWTVEGNTSLPRMTWLNQTWNLPNRLALANGGKLLAVQSFHHPRKWIFFGEPSREPRHRIHLFDTETGRDVGLIADAQSATFAPGNRTLAVTLGDGSVQLWGLPIRRPWGWIVLAALGAAALVYLLLAWRARRQRIRAARVAGGQ
ncbi:MAG: hypothetical protein L0Y71_00745 [Gemmataceae bacterium]|nr:hypothetical protein [Gemmataceae bacterium]